MKGFPCRGGRCQRAEGQGAFPGVLMLGSWRGPRSRPGTCSTRAQCRGPHMGPGHTLSRMELLPPMTPAGTLRARNPLMLDTVPIGRCPQVSALDTEQDGVGPAGRSHVISPLEQCVCPALQGLGWVPKSQALGPRCAALLCSHSCRCSDGPTLSQTLSRESETSPFSPPRRGTNGSNVSDQRGGPARGEDEEGGATFRETHLDEGSPQTHVVSQTCSPQSAVK